MLRFASILLLLFLSGCIARPLVKIEDPELHKVQSLQILESVLSQAKTGDWLVTRGYHATDNLVANATGTPISHAAVYNAETQSVIEAEGSGVHATALNDFVDKSYRVLIIRPRWLSGDNGAAAFSEAEKLVGKSYDFLGTVGFNFPDKYYCSELTINIYKEWHKPSEKFPTVIKPGDLYLYGEVLYDSLPRDEME